MPAKGAGMGKAGGATAIGWWWGVQVRGDAAPITGDSMGKALAYSKHDGHASKGCHARGSPSNLRVQN